MSTEMATYNTSTAAMIFDGDMLTKMQALAQAMAQAKVTVPAHFRGSPGDCLAVVMQAMQWQMNPFSVAQKTYLVNGILGYEAQLINAVIQSSGAINGRFHYEYSGDGQSTSCRVGAIPNGEESIVWGEWLRASDVTTKNSPLWKTNIKQQLGYLQVKNWARLYAPGAIMGVYSPDELESIPMEKEINPEPVKHDLKDKLQQRLQERKPVDNIEDIMEDMEPEEITLKTVLDAIARIEGKDTQASAKALLLTLTGEDRYEADIVYKEKVSELKAKKSKPEPKVDMTLWPNRIDACTSEQALRDLCQEMSMDEMDAHGEAIDLKFSSFGV
jgi:hypothetical protein